MIRRLRGGKSLEKQRMAGQPDGSERQKDERMELDYRQTDLAVDHFNRHPPAWHITKMVDN